MVRVAALIVALASVLCSGAPANAQWVRYRGKPTPRLPSSNRPSFPVNTVGWSWVTGGTDGSSWYLQDESLSHYPTDTTSETRQAWVLIDYTRSTNKNRSFKGLVNINCGSQQYSWYSRTYYSPQGEVTYSDSPGFYARTEYIIPDSIMMLVARRLCRPTEK